MSCDLGTDKYENGYIPYYERWFQNMRQDSISLLELGVAGGGSMRLWKEWFPHGTIVGLDERPCSPIENVFIYQGRQQDPSILTKMSQIHGPWDIIIDDCSHIARLALISLQVLYEHLGFGGQYFIEDWGTGYWDDWPDGKFYYPHTQEGMVGLVKDLVDEIGAEMITNPAHGISPSRQPRFSEMTVVPGIVRLVRA